MSIEYKDRLFPIQDNLKKNFTGLPGELPGKIMDCVADTSGYYDIYRRLDLVFDEEFSQEYMGTTPAAFSLLKLLTHMNRYGSALEIGSFVGINAICLAEILVGNNANNPKVVSIEKFDRFAAIARQNIEKNGYSDKINLITGDAMDIMSGLDQTFDLILIDGDKENYRRYALEADKLLNPGGLIWVDDVFFHGDVFNETCSTSKGEGVKTLLENLSDFSGYTTCILPLGDGILLMWKNS